MTNDELFKLDSDIYSTNAIGKVLKLEDEEMTAVGK